MPAPSVSCLVNPDYTAGTMTVVGRDMLGTEVDIYRYDQSTNNKLLVRGGYGYKVEAQTVIAVDPEVPLSETVIYEIVMMPNGRADPLRQSVFTSGCRLPDTSVAFNDGKCEPIYFSDPLIPSYGYWFGLLSIDPLAYPSRSELFDVLGRSAPVAVSQMRSTARTTIRLFTETLQQRNELLLMLQAGRILLLRNPDPSYPERHWYLSVGNVSEERIIPDHRDPRRRWVLEVAVVDRPVGYLALVKSERIYLTLETFEPDGITPITPATYAGTKTDYGDYVDALLGGGYAAAEEPVAMARGTALRAAPESQVYGEGRYPTAEAARTSWSLL
jgi:hypothetical protein